MRRSLCLMAWLLVFCCLVGCGAPAGSDPTQEPTQLITEIPTEEPTVEPSATADATTAVPTGTPTQVSTKGPTNASTVAPTVAPTKAPLIKEGMLTPGKAHIIIMSGQSNMVGRAQNKYLEQTATAKQLAAYKAGYENILIYYHSDHTWDGQKPENVNIATDFVPVTMGQGYDSVQFGPEIGLAEYLTEKFPGEKFYLIKCAYSGAGLFNCFTSSSRYYTEILSRINIGINKLKNAGLEPEIFAFCWMQGETDAMYAEHAPNYLANQTDMVNRWLPIYKKYAAPNGIAFIDAGISNVPQWTYYKTINDAKVTFQKQGTNRYYIDTIANGLTTLYENNDTSHYDSQSKIKLGRLFGQMIEMYLKGQQQ